MARGGHVRHSWVSAIVALGAATGCATVDSSRTLLDDLELEGNESVSAGEIEAKLALVETPDWPWADPQYFDRGTLAGDRRRLLRFYRARGYYEAKVRSRIVPEGPTTVDVTFVVEEGPPTRVERIDLKGLAGLPADVTARLDVAHLPLAVGAPVAEEAYDGTLHELARRLRNAGYADATVEGEVEVDVARHTAVVTVWMQPGSRVKFGKVIVSGAVHVPRKTILEAVEESIPKEKRYSEELIVEAQRSVFDLGVFGGVRVSRGPTNEANGTVPVIVVVRESPFQTVRVGAGAGVDTAREEARVTAEYTHRNFLGGLRRLAFENRLGYAYVPDVFAPQKEGIAGTSALDFTQPNLVRTIDGNLRLEYERGLEAAYSFDAIKGKVGLPWHLHRTLTFTPSYNLEFYEVAETETGGARRSGRAELSADCNSQKRGSDAFEPCVLAYVEERLAWDRRNDPINTTRGWYVALSAQQGSESLGSKFDYHKLSLEARWFQPVPFPRDGVVAVRLESGALLPREGQVSPIMERFFSGGGSSVRAFGTRRLSPQALRAECDADAGECLPDGTLPVERQVVDPDVTVPIGGDALLEGTAELRFPVWGDLGLVLFADAGNVTRGYAETDRDKKLLLLQPAVATGFGLRYGTLFGPVRLDLAYRVAGPRPTVIIAKSQGGVPVLPVGEPPFSFHFAIGEAF